MQQEEQTRYRVLIGAMLAELAAEDALGEGAQEVVTLDQQSVGRLSRMDALQNQAMAKATAARRGQQVLRLKAALVRLDEGEFGYCLDCGDDIAKRRLEFDPTAAKCIGCASG